MRVKVKKWGNSASVRIPAAIMDAAKLELDTIVDMREEHGQIIIVPLKALEYDLFTLVEGITPGNLHGAVDFGAPVGKEAL